MVFEKLNFTIKKGENIYLVGSNGSGKSIITKLLLGFIEYEGDIFIDDIDLKDLNKTKLRENIGLCFQTPYIFSDTIKNNIDKETIVGCISYFNYHKIYGNVNYISTVEINYFYQGMKLLNEMYKNFINELDFDKDIMITSESMIGRKCHVINDLKKALKKVKYDKNIIIDD